MCTVSQVLQLRTPFFTWKGRNVTKPTSIFDHVPPLNKRLAGHRANILNNTEGKVMPQHFKKHHNITDMIIKPIHSCAKEFLRNQETYWMQEINTIFPYGLNNRIAINNIKDAYNHITYNNETPIYTLFNQVKNNRTQKGSGCNRKLNTDSNPFDAATFITNMLEEFEGNIHKHCRASIMGLTLEKVEVLFLFINLQYNKHLVFVMKDLCLHRLTKTKKQKHDIKNYIILEFLHKNMDKINIKNILLSQQSKERLPIPTHHIEQTGFTYKYTRTIRNIVTNYNETVKTPNWTVQCSCAQYNRKFLSQHCGHIVTGDLEILDDLPTRDLLRKGLNFRLPQNEKRKFKNYIHYLHR